MAAAIMAFFAGWIFGAFIVSASRHPRNLRGQAALDYEEAEVARLARAAYESMPTTDQERHFRIAKRFVHSGASGDVQRLAALWSIASDIRRERDGY